MTAPALEVEKVTVAFDGLVAVDDVTLRIPQGGRHGILGPNGAGKTTLFNAITGFAHVTSGTVSVKGVDVTRDDAASRARLGLGRTFQITNLMDSLSTRENVMLGALINADEHRSWWRSYDRATNSAASTDRVIDLMHLGDVAHVPIKQLSYGDRRRVELAMAMAAEPSVLLLDEPAAGLSVADRRRMVELLTDMPEDLTTVVIEHDVEVIFAIADTVTVLHRGAVLMTGSNEEVKADERVKEVYLGAE